MEWGVVGPYIADMMQNSIRNTQVGGNAHHEDTDSFEKTFRKDRSLLYQAFKKFGNPFEDADVELVNIVSRQVLPQRAICSVVEAHNVGKKQYLEFVEERLHKDMSDRTSIYSVIPKNKLSLYRQKNIVSTGKFKLEASTLKERCKIYSALYVACQSRQANLDHFFKHMNHEYPPALSE